MAISTIFNRSEGETIWTTIGTVVMLLYIAYGVFAYICELTFGEGATNEIITWCLDKPITMPGALVPLSLEGIIVWLLWGLAGMALGFIIGIVLFLFGLAYGIVVGPFTAPFAIHNLNTAIKELEAPLKKEAEMQKQAKQEPAAKALETTIVPEVSAEVFEEIEEI